MNDDHREPTMHLKVLGYMELEDGDGRPVVSVLKRPKLAAFLGVLAVGDTAVRSRDRLMAMFWPQADSARASHSLNQFVYQLRKSLGDVVERRGDQLLVDPDLLRCDAIRFEASIEAEDFETAVSLYQGEFLEGLYVSDSPDFERWVDAQRSRLSRAAAQASWGLAERYAAESRFLEASTMARRAAECTPGEEAALRRLLGFLDAIGDRAGAVSAYEDFARHLRVEFGVEPSPETTALLEQIRARDEAIADLPVRRPDVADRAGEGAVAAVGAPEPAGVPAGGHTASKAPRARGNSSRWWLAVPAFAVLALFARLAFGPSEVTAAAKSVVAVDVAPLSADDESVSGTVRDVVADLATSDRFAVSAAAEGTPTVADLALRIDRYTDDGMEMVEARLLDPATGAVAAVQSFPSDGATQQVARFVRQRAGALFERRDLEVEADAEQIDALRRADRLISEGERHRQDVRVVPAWALFSSADSVLGTLEQEAPRWIEPPLRRGWLALERVFLLSGAEVTDSVALGVVPGPAGFKAILDEAERLADRVIDLEPASPWGYELRGAVHMGRLAETVFADSVAFRRAEADLTRAVEIDEYLPRAWRDLARLRQMSGDTGGALAALERALGSDPFLRHDLRVRWSVLRTAAWSDDGGRARTACREGRRDFPDDPIFADCELFLEGWLGPTADLERAEAAYRGLEGAVGVAAHRRHLRMMFLAGAAARAGEVERAIDVLDEAAALPPGPDSVATALERVRVLALIQEPVTATDSLSAIVGRNPGLAKLVPRDPRFEPLVGHPAFEALAESLRTPEG